MVPQVQAALRHMLSLLLVVGRTIQGPLRLNFLHDFFNIQSWHGEEAGLLSKVRVKARRSLGEGLGDKLEEKQLAEMGENSEKLLGEVTTELPQRHRCLRCRG